MSVKPSHKRLTPAITALMASTIMISLTIQHNDHHHRMMKTIKVYLLTTGIPDNLGKVVDIVGLKF